MESEKLLLRAVNFTLYQLIGAGMHLGHKWGVSDSKMFDSLIGIRHDLAVINLQRTVFALKPALVVIRRIAAKRGRVLFVNVHKHAFNAVSQRYADLLARCSTTPRKLPGLLTNFVKLRRQHSALRAMKFLPSFVVVSKKCDHHACLESDKFNVPSLALFDSDTNPLQHAFYTVVSNDDPIQVHSFLYHLVFRAIREGNALFVFNWESKRVYRLRHLLRMFVKFRYGMARRLRRGYRRLNQMDLKTFFYLHLRARFFLRQRIEFFGQFRPDLKEFYNFSEANIKTNFNLEPRLYYLNKQVTHYLRRLSIPLSLVPTYNFLISPAIRLMPFIQGAYNTTLSSYPFTEQLCTGAGKYPFLPHVSPLQLKKYISAHKKVFVPFWKSNFGVSSLYDFTGFSIYSSMNANNYLCGQGAGPAKTYGLRVELSFNLMLYEQFLKSCVFGGDDSTAVFVRGVPLVLLAEGRQNFLGLGYKNSQLLKFFSGAAFQFTECSFAYNLVVDRELPFRSYMRTRAQQPFRFPVIQFLQAKQFLRKYFRAKAVKAFGVRHLLTTRWHLQLFKQYLQSATYRRLQRRRKQKDLKKVELRRHDE